LPRGLVKIPLEYFENAIRWMRAQPWLRDGFLAAWGPSRGGELALLLGATFSDINAVSAWVPRATGRSQNIP
jgi:dienelactone hydrolase